VPEHQGTVARLVRPSTRVGVLEHHLDRVNADRKQGQQFHWPILRSAQ
jgi:hypothetical protein